MTRWISGRKQLCIVRQTSSVFVVLMLSGAETVSEIQTKVRPDRGLLGAFGYQRCADASVIQQTLDASTEATVASLESALAEVRLQQCQRHEVSSVGQEPIHVDIDLSALPIGIGCQERLCREKAEHLYRQLARLVCGKTQEIFSNQLYPGDTRSDAFSRRCLANLRLF